MQTNQTFGAAVQAAIEGKRIAREGWNGKGLFVFKQVPSPISADVVPRMTSLPQPVKDEFIRRQAGPNYRNQFAIVHPDNAVDSWAPSSSDAVAGDWVILD
jgi:hypothetical protein